jgi:hypothetical protein
MPARLHGPPRAAVHGPPPDAFWPTTNKICFIYFSIVVLHTSPCISQ